MHGSKDSINWISVKRKPCARCIEIRAEKYAGGFDVVVPGRTCEMHGKTCVKTLNRNVLDLSPLFFV